MGLFEKLKFKAGTTVYVIDKPDTWQPEFESVPKLSKTCSQVLFFAKDKKTLEAKLNKLVAAMTEDAVFWIAYPKKTGSIRSDLIRDDGWDALTAAGFEGVASAAINEDWTALRFRHSSQTKGLKRELPMEERKIEGIDFINRRVSLPADAVKAMKPFKGLAVFFNELAFSHKKEYVEAIVEAKKPETRQRRIEGMIELVLKMKEAKEAKLKAKANGQQNRK